MTSVEQIYRKAWQGSNNRKVYTVLDRAYETRQEAQAAVDAICDAGYGIQAIEEYEI